MTHELLMLLQLNRVWHMLLIVVHLLMFRMHLLMLWVRHMLRLMVHLRLLVHGLGLLMLWLLGHMVLQNWLRLGLCLLLPMTWRKLMSWWSNRWLATVSLCAVCS
jgi:hypothetical protein